MASHLNYRLKRLRDDDVDANSSGFFLGYEALEHRTWICFAKSLNIGLGGSDFHKVIFWVHTFCYAVAILGANVLKGVAGRLRLLLCCLCIRDK